VVSDEPSRSVVKRLRKAGFVKSDGRGSHSKWSHEASGAYSVHGPPRASSWRRVIA
jgi:predicted RNA binding protein YcfA (HicA-like mRNA interferase family)